MSAVRDLMERASAAHAVYQNADREYREAERALEQERLRIVSDGGKDVGVAWPLGTILTGNPEMGKSDRMAFVLALSPRGRVVVKRLTKDGQVHRGVNPDAYQSGRFWVEVSPTSAERGQS